MSTATPAHLHFGSSISLRSIPFSGYVLSGHSEDAKPACGVSFASARGGCEQWYLVNPANLQDTAIVRFGDVVALTCSARTTCYLSLEMVPPAGQRQVRGVSMRTTMADTERWRFIDPANPNSTEQILWGATVALRAATGPVFHLSCGWSGAMPDPRLGAASVPQCAAWETFHAMRGGSAVFSAIPPDQTPARGPHLQAGTIFLETDDQTQRVAGEKVTLEYADKESVRITSFTWTVQGEPIADYIDSTGTVVELPATLNQQVHVIYWRRPGQFNVTLTVTGFSRGPGNAWIPGTGSIVIPYTVRVPYVIRAVTIAGRVAFGADGAIPFRKYGVMRQIARSTVQLTGLTINRQSTGFLMAATVRADGNASGGLLRWTQLVRSVRTLTRSSGPAFPRTTGGEYWLDNVVSYSPEGDQPFDRPILATSQGDSPSESMCTQTVDAVGVKEVIKSQVADSFKMHVMWRSALPGSCWVAIGRFDWFWESLVEKAGAQAALAVVSNDFTNKAIVGRRNVLYDITSHELPTWTQVMNSNSFRNPLDNEIGDDQLPVMPTWPRAGAIDIPPQSGEGVIIFQLDSSGKPPFIRPGFPGQPGPQYPEAMLGRAFGPTITWRGETWRTTWASLARVASLSSFLRPQLLPRECKVGQLDLSPVRSVGFLPGNLLLYALVAPFCFGNPDYWSRFAHEPIEGLESDDYSLNGYRNLVSSMTPGAVVMRRREDPFSVWILFRTPTVDQAAIDRIADLPQTYNLRRWPDGAPYLPPVPDDPNGGGPVILQ